MVNNTPPARWFRRVLWLAIAGNVVLALPVIAAPSAMLALADLAGAAPDVWPRLAAVQAIVLAAFYAPAAFDVDRHRATAWLAVGAHAMGAVFFALEPGFRLFAAYDLILALALGVLLAMAIRSRYPAGSTAAAATF
jgi:hypothetical protein